MNKLSKYILSLLSSALITVTLTSCNDEPYLGNEDREGVQFSADGNMLLSLKMDIPGMEKVSTRAMGETPDFENLSLYLLVFENGKGLSQFSKLETTPYNDDPQHGHDKLVTINSDIELQPTVGNATIHLIATNQPDFGSSVGYGTEERVITALTTRNGYEAYWQRIDLGSNIPSADVADPSRESFVESEKLKAEAINAKMKHVPMVRNFCRISTNTSAVEETFLLTGIYLVNTVDCGTVAPYVAENAPGSRFVTYYNDPSGSGQPWKAKDYNEISAQNHIGTLPEGVKLINTGTSPDAIATKSESATGDIQPIYFYERMARPDSRERSFIVLRGKYNGHDDSYYKIDIGNVGDDELGIEIGLFEYYNLLRNFDYCVNILKVESDGYPTFEGAANGVIYNNFSAALEVRSMANISDGEDYFYLNKSSFVFTDDKTRYIRVQYREGIDDGKGGEIRNEDIKIMIMDSGKNGPVIQSIEFYAKETDEDGEWYIFEVIGYPPTSVLKDQEVYIYRGKKENGEYGLYRVLTFYSQTPWPIPKIQTYPDHWVSFEEMKSQTGWDWTTDEIIGGNTDAPLTLFFELPPGIPQALFPVTFTIESDRQNIQNEYLGTAVVQSVEPEKSLFYDRKDSNGNSLINTSRIQYVKTVTWEEYNTVDQGELTANGSLIVHVRFNTITDLNQDIIGDGDQSLTTIRVGSEYFGRVVGDDYIMYHEDTFRREK